MNSLFPNLHAAMEKHGVTTKSLAKVIGCSEVIVRLKLRGVMDWTLVEALTICQYLHCPDLESLFLR